MSGRRANASRPSTPRRPPVDGDHAKPAARSTAHSSSTGPTMSTARTIVLIYSSGSCVSLENAHDAHNIAGCMAAARCAEGWAPGCKRPRRVVSPCLDGALLGRCEHQL